MRRCERHHCDGGVGLGIKNLGRGVPRRRWTVLDLHLMARKDARASWEMGRQRLSPQREHIFASQRRKERRREAVDLGELLIAVPVDRVRAVTAQNPRLVALLSQSHRSGLERGLFSRSGER